MAAKRNAHRGVVKKRIQELDTILAEEEPDLTRLKQLRLLFIEKIEVLGKLDEEVLDGLGDEAAMGADIEEADAFRQDVCCAIERLEAKLDSSSLEVPATPGQAPPHMTRPLVLNCQISL